MKPATTLGLIVGLMVAGPTLASPSGSPLQQRAPVGEVGPPPGSARPLTNPGTWVTTADYPPRALRENQEGVTGFRIDVSPEGTVADCQIIASSGAPLLDQTTCDLIRQRARFAPATDAAGKPVAGRYMNRVRWTIPRPARPEPGELTLSYLVAPDGTRSDCRIEKAEGGAAQAIGKMDPCRSGNFASGYVDGDGKGVTRRVRSTIRIEVLPVH